MISPPPRATAAKDKTRLIDDLATINAQTNLKIEYKIKIPLPREVQGDF
jgi:aspartate carbamoyltransferase regulatory subunit